MTLVKFLLELFLITIMIFFVWNIMKRLFFRNFYKKNLGQEFENTNRQSDKNSSGRKGLNWDAETVDYEEIVEEKSQKHR